MARETPQKKFDNYKKELGKQYMDGLISDIEYDGMLKAKEAELGLNQPTIADDEGPECPSCGALIDEQATECLICGIALEPVIVQSDSIPIPSTELDIEGPEGLTCSNCGSEISEMDTVCTMCGHVFGTEIEQIEESSIVDAPLDDEIICPSCGAFVEADATECMICDTPLEKTPVSVTSMEVEESPIATEDTVEIVCAGCGAVLDEGSSECFICGEAVGVEPSQVEEFIEEPITPAEIEISEEEPGELPEPISEPEILEDDSGLQDIQDELPPVELPKEELPPVELSKEELPPLEPLDEELQADIVEEVPEAEFVEEIILQEGEIICPSCSSVIPEESDKCPECWTDFSLYIRCPACSLLTPFGEESCRECFAPFDDIPSFDEELTEVGFIPGETDSAPFDVEIPDAIEITEELKEEMTTLELEEEQGKECLVCGAIFGPGDEVCPICFMEYGTEIEEPEKVEYETWEKMDVAVLPTTYLCPNCGENVTGLDASDREINEGRWFYRGIVSIFIGIFFTSFSIYARGISAENASLGLNPPPTDVLLNVIGWILVLTGFMFWLFSWKLHDERMECSSCGIEINPDMANCINCGEDLTLDEDEDYEDEPAEVYDDALEETYEEPVEDFAPDEDLEVPEESYEAEVSSSLVEPEESEIPEPEPAIEPELGTELPVEHEEHKQCPGCGIFVDLSDAICPVCDTEFEAVKIIESETVADEDIKILSEEDELAALEAEPSIDDVTVPEDGIKHVECPSCGADVDADNELCPVCEYPLSE